MDRRGRDKFHWGDEEGGAGSLDERGGRGRACGLGKGKERRGRGRERLWVRQLLSGMLPCL